MMGINIVKCSPNVAVVVAAIMTMTKKIVLALTNVSREEAEGPEEEEKEEEEEEELWCRALRCKSATK